MGSYVPNTSEEQREMLREIGFDSSEALFFHIPQDVRVKSDLKPPEGLGEMEVIGKMKEITQQSVVFKHIFRGVGAYSHYVPTIIKSVVPKGGLLTSYIPYQAEISQGILQSISECQTMLCELTGMNVPNAPVYNGAMAMAEAATMCRDRKRSEAYLSVATHPQVIEVVRTYYFGSGTQVVIVPEKNGATDADALRELLDDMTPCFYVQQPNYYGNLEKCGLSRGIIREKGVKYIMDYNPVSLAFLPTPVECSMDIAVGDGQPLGIPLCFGDPYLGFITATSTMGRKLPDRIVGETRDVDDKKMYVLAPQARERHIRHEKASPNVCSNQALCALTASVYVATAGGEGLRKTAVLCTSKAHYLKEQLEQAGLMTRYDREFFYELVIGGDMDNGLTLKALEEKGVLGELPLNDGEILWCAAERNRKEDISQAAQIVKKVRGG